MSHTAAMRDISLYYKEFGCGTIGCLETASKTNKNDHIFSLQRVVQCKADTTGYTQEPGSVY